MIWLYDNIEMRIEGRIIVRVLHLVRTHLALNSMFVERRCDPGTNMLSPLIQLCRHYCILPVSTLFALIAYLDTFADHWHFQGFDEFMNVVVDEAAEVYVKDAKPRRELGEQHSTNFWIVPADAIS